MEPVVETITFYKIVEPWIAILTLLIGIATFTFLVFDRFTICKIKLSFSKIQTRDEDPGGFHVPRLSEGVQVAVYNRGKEPFYIHSLEIHSDYLINEPFNVGLIHYAFWPIEVTDKPKQPLYDKTFVNSRRRINTEVSFERLLAYLDVPSGKQSIKLWVVLVTESGRVFHSNRLTVPTKLLETNSKQPSSQLK